MAQRGGKATPSDEDFVDISGNGSRGLLKKILTPGSRHPLPDKAVVTVHYTGKLLTGEIFDSSKKRNQPFTFNLGQREVILGWDIGVQTMTKGETAILKISPEYGYGNRTMGPIPANSTLLFEVELIDWKPIDESIYKKLLAVFVLSGIAIFILYNRFK